MMITPNWQRGILQDVTRIAGEFGPRDVIVTDKDGINLLSNMQPFKTDEAFMNTKVPVLAPYKNTHFLLNSDYFGIFSPLAVRRMFEQAESHHLLDTIDRIVILKIWNRWPFYDLVSCASLPKEIVYPPMPSQRPLFPGEFTIVVVSKKALFDKVLFPGGVAQKCLDEHQDTIPEWYYVPRTAKHDSYFRWTPDRKE